MTILFPYMARWNSANRSRYYHLFLKAAKNGHRVIVIQPPPRVSQETSYIDIPEQENPNIVLHTVSMNGWLWNLSIPFDKFFKKALYTIGSTLTIRQLARTERPDIIVVYNLPQYVYTIGMRVPVVFDFADDYMAMFQHELGVGPRHPLYRIGSWILRRLQRKAILVTCVSELLVKKVDHRNVALLPNGADSGEPAREPSLHIDRSRPVIGYVGAFEYFIDLELMLDAAEGLPDHTFLLVGAGREFAAFKDEVTRRRLRNTILTGAVPHHQAMRFIDEMDICLNLFVKGDVAHAASPIKLFEYLAHGRPVISTRLEEVERLDAQGRLFYYADNLADVKGAVRRITEDREDRSRRVQQGLDLIQSGYTWDALALQFVSLVEGSLAVIDGRQRR